jgi:GDP-4-dehydro-6-deoxy-D-mannose reductase
VRARAFNHAGPGQRTGFVIPALVDRVLVATAEAASTVAVGDLSPTRDFTDVRDVVRAYRLLMHHGAAGEAYNVCSGLEISIGEVLEMVIAACGADITAVVDPLLLRPVDVPRRVGDNTKLRRATGWTPSFNLNDTLDAVVADRHGHHPVSDTPAYGEH